MALSTTQPLVSTGRMLRTAVDHTGCSRGAIGSAGPEAKRDGTPIPGRAARVAWDGAVLARVEHPPGARRFDSRTMQADHIGGRVVVGHQKDLVRAGERGTQRGRIFVGALPHAHTTVGEVLRLGGVSDTDTDLTGRYALEEMLDGGTAQPGGSAGDNDHVLVLPECPRHLSQWWRSIS